MTDFEAKLRAAEATAQWWDAQCEAHRDHHQCLRFRECPEAAAIHDHHISANHHVSWLRDRAAEVSEWEAGVADTLTDHVG